MRLFSRKHLTFRHIVAMAVIFRLLQMSARRAKDDERARAAGRAPKKQDTHTISDICIHFGVSVTAERIVQRFTSHIEREPLSADLSVISRQAARTGRTHFGCRLPGTGCSLYTFRAHLVWKN